MAFDRGIFEAVQSLTGNPVLDQAMMFFAEYLVILIPLSLIYLWFQDRDGKVDSVLIFGATVTGIATAYAMSMLYSHQNPSVTYETIIAADSTENAFPSHHTATVFSAAFGLLARKRKTLGYLMVAAAVLTGFARVYVGEHWPMDILGSVVASTTGVIVAYYGEPVMNYLEPIFELSEKVEDKVRAFL